MRLSSVQMTLSLCPTSLAQSTHLHVHSVESFTRTYLLDTGKLEGSVYFRENGRANSIARIQNYSVMVGTINGDFLKVH